MSYDEVYGNDDFYWGLKPHHLTKDSLQYVSQGSTILDIGCGEGKNSFFLARHGIKVTAIDASSVGVDKLNQYAKEHGLTIDTQVTDVLAFFQQSREAKHYDAMYALNVLQFFS